MGISSDTVFRRGYRTSQKEMSRGMYTLTMCLCTAAGVLLSAAASFISESWDLTSWSSGTFWGFFLGILAVAIAGCYVALNNDKPLVSTIGFVMVAGPFGLMLGPVVAMYTTSSVVQILAATTLFVVVLGIVGALIPDNLASWGTTLSGALLLLLAGYVIVPFLAMIGMDVGRAFTLLDWIGLIVFGGLIIFDLNRALMLPYTLDNAIDSAMAVYLDFINVFIRLLSLYGEED